MVRPETTRKRTARTNILPRGTSFVGRVAQLTSLREALSSSAVVTVLGPPGMGKTRLAKEHALREAEAYPGGVFRCDLTDVAGVDGVCAVVAAVLDVPLAQGRGPGTAARVGEALAARGRVLIVLDNFEHLVEIAPETVEVWRRLAPEARFLATSRERLWVEGELLIDLAALGLPEDDATASEAVQLFVERAQLVVPGYTLAAQEAPYVAALARELDGLPLAIELAAARMRVFSAEALLATLRERRFDLLVSRRAPAHGRHASLYRAIESAWAALTLEEQAALRQCSVFRGGFDLAAAERVLSLGDGAPWVADVLQSLRDKSLLVRDDACQGPTGPCFSLLVSIRDHAWDKLVASGDAEATLARHAAHYLAEGSALAAKADGPEGVDARRRLSWIEANLLAVHARALSASPKDASTASRAVEAALALQPLLRSGPLQRCAALLDPVLAGPEAAHVPPRARAQALAARAEAHRLMGAIPQALDDAEAARALAASLPDAAILTGALLTLAFVHHYAGQRDRMRACIEEARAARGAPDPRLEGRAMAWLGLAELVEGRNGAANDLFRRALALHRKAGDLWYEGNTEGNLAASENEAGHHSAAVAHGRRALAIHRATGNRPNEAVVLLNLGLADLVCDRLAAAEAHFEESLRVFDAIGARRYVGRMVLAYLGAARHIAGRRAEARATLDAAIADADVGNIALCVAHAWLACLAAAEGRLDDAVEAFAAAEREPMNVHRVHAGMMDMLRGHLDLARARAAAAAGEREVAAAHRAAVERRLAVAPEILDVRLLHKALVLACREGELEDAGEAPDGTLVVHAQGVWFRLPSGERIDNSRRRAAARVLGALARARLDTPGTPMTPHALIELGWPGERIQWQAAQLRLRGVVNTLRRLGLRDLLLTWLDGYLLDPNIPVRIARSG